ncbi:MAG: FAD-dependent oxidoreductase [Candidatus Eisenbacteria bacterium]|nr:FAD-dependent oxidoreductase [Candidatus Eisenbacteria bacterium]
MTGERKGPRGEGSPAGDARRAAAAAMPEPRLTGAQALAEAARCLQCFDAPCTRACPAGIVIPRFIRMLSTGNVRGAAETVRAANPLAASCGVACPGEDLCGAACLRAEVDRPVAIRRLHRFATETDEARGRRPPELPAARRGRVAVVGAGPAGMACAFELRRRGIAVTVFDRARRPGGVLSASIPIYRFPDTAWLSDAAWALAGHGRKAGAALRLGATVGDVAALARRFDAVFVATGLQADGPALKGSHLAGVTTAEAFLRLCRRRRYRNRVGRAVVVIGGGNVAIDAAIGAVRCGEGAARAPLVRLLYRRTRSEMPAWEREIVEAESSGVILQTLTLPVELVGKEGKLAGIRIRRAVPGRIDASGRRRPRPVAGSETVIPCDQAILALGQRLERGPLGGLDLDPDGLLRADPETRHVRGNVYAGGDAAGGEGTIVAAVRDGKVAAGAIAGRITSGVTNSC